MTKIFDKEVDSWASLYPESSGAGSGRYAIFQGNAEQRARVRAERCMALLDPQPGQLIVDVGCGTGVLGERVIARGARWIGLDISLPMLRFGRDRHPARLGAQAGWVNASLADLPLDAAVADGILCVGVLNFFPRADLPALLASLTRPLRPGATLVLTSLRLDILTWLRSRLYPTVPVPLSSPGPLYPHHFKVLEPLLAAAGLRCEQILHATKYFSIPHYTALRLTRL